MEKQKLIFLLGTVLTLSPAQARDAGAGCPAPVIAEPAADVTLATSRPAIRWEPVPSASGYRV